jgi:oxygen-independent coproporphyrinogen-3 oxidase
MNAIDYRTLAVPRYTSYPTAPHFSPSIDEAAYRSWLDTLPQGAEIGLYLHIPFCAELCWYCGCHTRVARGRQPIADYVALLAREIALVGGACRIPRATSLHWGGGTPNMLKKQDLEALMAELGRRFALARDIEVSAEFDPRVLTEDQVRAFIASGLTRASLGIQDFDADVQHAIHRIQPYEMTARSVEWLRRHGVQSVNFDLIYGLPLQTVASVLATVDKAATLRPERVALFGYAHVPWMKRHQRLLPEASLPGPAARQEQSQAAADRLVEHGYVRVGIDHFALPDDQLARLQAEGKLHRNFQGYTTEASQALIGFGISAIGTMPQGYVQNTTDVTQYRERILAGRLATTRGLAVTGEDRLRRDVIERLMCDLTVDLAEVAQRHHRQPQHFASERTALQPLVAAGIARVDGWRVTVPETARPLARLVCAAFDAYLKTNEARYSRAV